MNEEATRESASVEHRKKCSEKLELLLTQRKNLSKFGFKALIGGTLASLLSATIAGMIIG